VDAGVISPPTTVQARKRGLHEIANLATYDVEYYTAPIVAKKSWLKDNHDLALKVMQGYAAGIAMAHRDKAATMSIIGKYTKTDDKDVLEDAYASLISALPKVPVPALPAVQTGLAQTTLPAAKTADPASFIDASLMEELQKNGFIDSLYK
jgi:NitT/TauT family transport system substrate-binding protein